MPGWIMPAPLQMPPMRMVCAPSLNSTAISLGRVSLVMMASTVCAAFSREEFKRAAAAAMPRFTLGMGRVTPMRPVEATSTWAAGTRRIFAVTAAISSASRRPRAPVQALALPELTTMARAVDLFARGRLTLTGAAQTWLVVNSPATAAGVSETMSARSRLLPLLEPLPVPRCLMSQNTPAARKPLGAVTEPGMDLKPGFMEFERRKSNEAGGLGETAEDVHALDGLAAGALDEVVLGAHDDQPAGARVEPPGDFDDVGADDVLGVGKIFGVQEAHERFTGVGGLIAGGDFFVEFGRFIGVRKMVRGREVKRGEDAAIDGDEVRRELDGDGRTGGEGEFLLDFREVPVFGHGVGPDAFVALDEKIILLDLAARAADAAEGIGDDAGGFDETGAQKRQQGEQNAGGIAAGRRDEHGVFDCGTIDLGQTVNGGGEEIGRGMVVRVEFLIDVGAAEAEIGAEVDDLSALLEEWDCEFRRDAV